MGVEKPMSKEENGGLIVNTESHYRRDFGSYSESNGDH